MPLVNQREVYMLPFPAVLDDGETNHPFIVLSCDEANDNNDHTFIGVMITSSRFTDDNSFYLTDEMFEKPLAKQNCHVRMHLITLCIKEDIQRARVNKMREKHFHQLMKTIGELVFNYKFEKMS